MIVIFDETLLEKLSLNETPEKSQQPKGMATLFLPEASSQPAKSWQFRSKRNLDISRSIFSTQRKPKGLDLMTTADDRDENTLIGTLRDLNTQPL